MIKFGVKNNIIALSLTFCIIFGSISVSADSSLGIIQREYGKVKKIDPNRAKRIEKLEKILDHAKENYYKPINEDEIFEGIYKSALNSLDEHSYYMSPKEAKKFLQEVNGRFYGVGFIVTSKDKMVHVVKAIENTPAHRAGIVSGDVILKVNDIDIKDYSLDQVVEMVRSDSPSVVKLQIKKKDSQKIVELDIQREIITSSSVELKVVDEIGVLTISNFSDSAYVRASELISQNANLKGMIIDLRGNGGGYLNAATRLANMFLPDGALITTAKYGSKSINEIRSDENYLGLKLVVLIDGYSASASEVFAGALRDNKRATLIGTKSFGKGTIQSFSPVDVDGSMVKLTIGEYKLPSGAFIDKIGITPDIVVEKPKYEVDKFYPMNSMNESKLGSYDIDTYGMQQRLNFLGYQLHVDGKFGQKSMQALMDWQAKAGLEASGVLDVKSKIKLSEAVKNVQPSDRDVVLEKALEFIKK